MFVFLRESGLPDLNLDQDYEELDEQIRQIESGVEEDKQVGYQAVVYQSPLFADPKIIPEDGKLSIVVFTSGEYGMESKGDFLADFDFDYSKDQEEVLETIACLEEDTDYCLDNWQVGGQKTRFSREEFMESLRDFPVEVSARMDIGIEETPRLGFITGGNRTGAGYSIYPSDSQKVFMEEDTRFDIDVYLEDLEIKDGEGNSRRLNEDEQNRIKEFDQYLSDNL